MIVSRGFRGKRRDDGPAGRFPPGQYVTPDFPVLSAGPTPRRSIAEWEFTIVGKVDEPLRWTWEQFRALPSETVTGDELEARPRGSDVGRPWEDRRGSR